MKKYLFITGKLAAKALHKCLGQMKTDFRYDISALNCTVAALMNTEWIANHLAQGLQYDMIFIPGLSEGDISLIEDKTGIPAKRGPKDLKDIPLLFGENIELKGYGPYKIKIIAEIVDAYTLSINEIIKKAEYYRASGADIIDLGGPAKGSFRDVEMAVKALKASGFRVSIDSFDRETILKADRAGADIILSVNSANMDIAKQVSAKVVLIPDFDGGLESLMKNAARLDDCGKGYILDPVLDPLCLGFIESIERYINLRKCYPDKEIMMGLGNLTELIDADSNGINALMAGVATELDINYLLTTEVISWAKGSVKELDRARRLMHYAYENHMPPKRINYDLVMLKDPPFDLYDEEELRGMQKEIEDKNYRIFTDNKMIYLFNRDIFIYGNEPQEIFDRLKVTDTGHAFYLGKELERAALAIRLGKRYVQEEPLRWGSK
ncbi:MAG: dihydropteroate synthase [Deltaproteobacteria bacterium]|nr:dihydropteroate synthase [Deltaproteobacteria bacterium]